MTPHLLLLSWQRWDADYYLDASLHGYYKPELTAFFPLYPLLIHGATALLGTTHVLIAALLISNLATLGAFIGISCLVMQEGGDLRTAGQTLLVLAAYPLAFFLAAPYAEGVFLACAVWALLAARRGWWYWAALLGFLGALSRPTGVILLLPLVYEFGRQQGWWGQAMAFARQRDWGQLWAAIRQWSWRKAGALLERRSKSQAASPKTGRRARTCKLLMVAQRRRSKRFLRSPR
jgi:Gpi18-like mannosyltransferase